MEDKYAGKIAGFKVLVVWQKGMELAKMVYRLTSGFPSDEKFGLISQMRRAAVSIPSNIAEGQAHSTTGEFLQFLSYARGSLAELETQLRLSVELGFCPSSAAEPALRLAEQEAKMLNSLRGKLAAKS